MLQSHRGPIKKFLMRSLIRRACTDKNCVIYQSLRHDFEATLRVVLSETYEFITNPENSIPKNYIEIHLKECLYLLQNATFEDKNIICRHLYDLSCTVDVSQSFMCISLISDPQSIQYRCIEYLLDETIKSTVRGK
jgi:hypothetical protein